MPIKNECPKLPSIPREPLEKIKDENISESTKIIVNGKLLEIKFDDLILVKHLGQGHFGRVSLMKVEKRGVVYEFAVKELKILNADVRASRIPLESEFGIRMSHCQFAVITYGVVAMGDCVRILMETMDSSVGRLQDKLKILKISWPEYSIAFITKCVVKGLEFLRQKNIQHRDVKPTNMLVNKLGCVKLCDYGVSQQMQDETTATTFVGTYVYMAPERLIRKNKNKRFRIQSDIWSLGLSVYAITTGSLPFPDRLDLDGLHSYFEENKEIEIPDDGTFTPEQREFLVACLKLDENERPVYTTLLKMDFLTEVKIKCIREVFAKFVRKILETEVPFQQNPISPFCTPSSPLKM